MEQLLSDFLAFIQENYLMSDDEGYVYKETLSTHTKEKVIKKFLESN